MSWPNSKIKRNESKNMIHEFVNDDVRIRISGLNRLKIPPLDSPIWLIVVKKNVLHTLIYWTQRNLLQTQKPQCLHYDEVLGYGSFHQEIKRSRFSRKQQKNP